MTITFTSPQALVIGGNNTTLTELKATEIKVVTEISRKQEVYFLEIDGEIRVRIENVKSIVR